MANLYHNEYCECPKFRSSNAPPVKSHPGRSPALAPPPFPAPLRISLKLFVNVSRGRRRDTVRCALEINQSISQSINAFTSGTQAMIHNTELQGAKRNI